MKRLILHIPHSSTIIPIKDGYLVNQSTLDEEILKLTDWYTEDLFYSEEDIMVVAEFSRIFCDVERFPDNEQEIMSKFGMGVLYEMTDSGIPLRKVTQRLRNKVLSEYYWTHHTKLNDAVRDQLEAHSKATIIDCHSFPEIPLNSSFDKNPERPDINIGTDPYHTPKELIEKTRSYFESHGLKVWIDKPYNGSMVPTEYFQKNKSVESIMIEVNRKLYLEGISNSKSLNYTGIKKWITGYYKFLKMA